MPTLLIDNAVIYEGDDGNRKTIVDFLDVYGNLGTLPLHSLDENEPTVPKVVSELAQEYQELAEDAQNPLAHMSYVMAIAYYIRQNMKKYRPMNALVIGGHNGILCYALARLARLCHPDSRVYCLTGYLYDDALLGMLGRLGDDAACVNLLSADTDGHILNDDTFDFVAIDGTEDILEPALTVKNAARATKRGGTLLCATQRQALLEDAFRLCVDGFDEFPIELDNDLLVKDITETDQQNAKQALWKIVCEQEERRISAQAQEIKERLSDIANAGYRELAAAAAHFSELEQDAIEIFDHCRDIELRNRLAEYKLALLNELAQRDAAR